MSIGTSVRMGLYLYHRVRTPLIQHFAFNRKHHPLVQWPLIYITSIPDKPGFNQPLPNLTRVFPSSRWSHRHFRPIRRPCGPPPSDRAPPNGKDLKTNFPVASPWPLPPSSSLPPAPGFQSRNSTSSSSFCPASSPLIRPSFVLDTIHILSAHSYVALRLPHNV